MAPVAPTALSAVGAAGGMKSTSSGAPVSHGAPAMTVPSGATAPDDETVEPPPSFMA